MYQNAISLASPPWAKPLLSLAETAVTVPCFTSFIPESCQSKFFHRSQSNQTDYISALLKTLQRFLTVKVKPLQWLTRPWGNMRQASEPPPLSSFISCHFPPSVCSIHTGFLKVPGICQVCHMLWPEGL